MPQNFKKTIELFKSTLSTQVDVYWEYDVMWRTYKVLMISQCTIAGRHFQVKIIISHNNDEYKPEVILGILFKT